MLFCLITPSRASTARSLQEKLTESEKGLWKRKVGELFQKNGQIPGGEEEEVPRCPESLGSTSPQQQEAPGFPAILHADKFTQQVLPKEKALCAVCLLSWPPSSSSPCALGPKKTKPTPAGGPRNHSLRSGHAESLPAAERDRASKKQEANLGLGLPAWGQGCPQGWCRQTLQPHRAAGSGLKAGELCHSTPPGSRASAPVPCQGA